MTLMQKIVAPAFSNDDRDDQLNVNFGVAVVMETEKLPWQSSPVEGVMRKRLELVGRSQPRLTTLVKFDPGSSFNRHGHDGGEEFLVLEGVFSDASGDYPAGYYLRNPPGTEHAPFTREGCVILVKLRQFQAGDEHQLAVNTTDIWARWRATTDPGVTQLPLHEYAAERVRLLKFNPQCWLTAICYDQGVEIFIWEGALSIDEVDYPQGSWLRFPPGCKVRITAPTGAKIYMKEPVSGVLPG